MRSAMCRDLPLDGGLEAFFCCDMAQGAPAAAVTSVEFASRIGDPSAASASMICISEKRDRVQRIRQRYNASSGTAEAIKHSDFISVKGARGTGMGSCGQACHSSFHPLLAAAREEDARTEEQERNIKRPTCHLYGHRANFSRGTI